MQCSSFINNVFKDRSSGFSTPDVYDNCFNPSSFTLNPNALDFSPNIFRSFTLNPSAPDFYPDVAILDSQGSADWDTLYSNGRNESNEQDPIIY